MKRLFLLLSLLSLSTLACTIILPPHPWPPPRRPAPPPPPQFQPMEVRSHRVTIEATEHTANVGLEAVFFNPNNRRIEGTYIFPIPPEAAVSSFSMTVNGKTLEAELLEADKARSIYEGIVRQQRDPALLEYLGHGMLKARVFPIEPHSEVKVALSYDQHLTADSGLVRLRYPLLSAQPGGDGRIGTVSIDVNLQTKHPLKTLYTPQFESDVERREGATGGRVTWEAGNYRPERDFEILFSTGQGKVGVDMLTYRKAEQGYFLLFISPNSELQAEEIAAKDITFVVDTSGSMNGQKIRQVKEALRFCVNNLGEDDHFNIVSFATDVLPLAAKSLPVSKANRDKALEFVDGLNARGGTAIDAALAFALQAKVAEQSVPLIVFLTDGLPTIGEVDPTAILKRFDGETNKRVFTFGVGDDVHTKLLDSLASDSRGYTTYVRPGEDLELALSGFYEKVASPVMTDLELDAGDIRLSELAPRELPDLFKGGQLVVAGRYRGNGTVPMVLSGEVAGRREKFRFEVNLDGSFGNAFIPRLWAVRRVGFLQEQIRLHGKNQELIDEIKLLGREFGILTPYTSFLVVEEGLAVGQRRAAREEFDRLENAYLSAPASGSAAVDAAESESRMKAGRPAPMRQQAEVLAEMPSLQMSAKQLSEVVVQAADKTFYLRHGDGFLYDATIPAGTTPTVDQEVELWSDAFFKLLDTYPQLRQYIRAGKKLVVEIDGKIYRFSD